MGMGIAGSLAILWLLMTGAYAQDVTEFPQYFAVYGVAADDQLNIRAEPNGSATIIGALDPGFGPVEILETVDRNGRAWGRMARGEGNGWVAMRFLAPMQVALVEDTQVPVGLHCFGTEPFWGLAIGADTLELSQPDGVPLVAQLTSAVTAAGRNHRFGLIASGNMERMTALLSRAETCSDGMSDALFGWRIDLLVEGEGLRQYEGCCSLR